MTDDRSASWKAPLENPPKNEFQDGKKGCEWNDTFDATVAFLGPTLWSKTLQLDGDSKVDYMDLDDFLIGDKEARNGKTSTRNSEDDGFSYSSSNDSCHEPENGHDKSFLHGRNGRTIMLSTESCFSPGDLALATFPGKNFDPSSMKFTDSELKPQPMFKKCKKQLVPNEMKDDRYWTRRLKNNVAAKRSRDVRRIKENQIVMRAAFLEKENYALKMEMDALRQENQSLLAKLRNKTPR